MNNNSFLPYGGGYGSSALYTDLAVESREADKVGTGVNFTQRKLSIGKWETVQILTEEAARRLERPIGCYSTLSVGRMDLLSEEEALDAQDFIARELCALCEKLGVNPDRILAVGLGNRSLTPDTVGTKSADLINPTLHVREDDEETFHLMDCSEISVICPGVTAKTGLEALEIIKGVVRRVIPSLVIVIDSISTRSPERLGRTVQISDVGISPGSGIGNKRRAINAQTLGCPVISLGIPTVIDSRALTGRDDGESMLVSPREIDEITDAGAKILSGAVNQAFGII